MGSLRRNAPRVYVGLATFFVLIQSGNAQSSLNPYPSRVLGQSTLEQRSGSPNLVEGRELWLPWSIAIDRSTTPPTLYVSDSANNRVLAWRNANAFAIGAPADFVVGQFDLTSTVALGPGTARATGISAPGAIAVDRTGNLYVVDAGNNRILRFPKPASSLDDPRSPDLVLGQAGFSTRLPNTGGVSAQSIATSSGNTLVRGGLAFDTAGNLYYADTLNNRVLRYPASVLGAGQNQPAANLVLGQSSFTTNVAPAPNAASRANRAVLRAPTGIAVDPEGRVYVADDLARVLVFAPPLANGASAVRLLGVSPQGSPSDVNPSALLGPAGVFVTSSGGIGVVDRLLHRIVIFPAFGNWPAETPTAPSPAADVVIGQADFFSDLPNRSRPEPSEATLNSPISAAVSGNELFVADTGNHRVLVFSQIATGVAASRLLGQISYSLSSPNLVEGRELFFINPGDIPGGAVAVDTSSTPPRLYIADTYNNRVLGYQDARNFRTGARADLVIGQNDLSRTLINAPWNSVLIPTDSGLYRPTGLIVDTNGDLFVADSGNARVLRFPSPFASRTPTGERQRANLVLGQANLSTRSNDPSASTTGYPIGLAFTADRSVAVSDAAFHRVLVFRRPQGRDFVSGMAAERVIGQADFVSGTRAAAAAPNRFNVPGLIGIDARDRLYVPDTGNNRVVIFDINNPPSNDPAPAFTLPNIGARAVLANPRTNEIWIADTRTNRGLRFGSYEALAAGSPGTAEVSSPGPLALALDAAGNLFVADALNRVALFFNGLSTQIAANYSDRPLSPGTIAILYPRSQTITFSTATQSFNELPNPIPLPTELADTRVMVGDTVARLYFVSPGQINFLVPMTAPSSGTVEVQVVRVSTGDVLGSSLAQMDRVSPGLFVQGGGEQGQLAALNQDNSVNSPATPIRRGEVIQLFGTGQGFVPGAPPDGTPPDGPVSTQDRPSVLIGNTVLGAADVLYSGLAPSLVGVWQINVRVPATIPASNNTEVAVVLGSIPSNRGTQNRTLRTTIAVR